MLKAMIDGLSGQSAIGIRPQSEQLAGDGIQMLLNGILASEAS